MSRRLVLLLPLLVTLALAAVFAVALLRPAEPAPSPLVGRPVPEFALADLHQPDRILTAADLLRGQPVVVNFFASWCVPCIAEHPQLMTLRQQDGVAILGIAWRDQPAAARQFLKDHGDPFALAAQDPDNIAGLEFGLTGVPETFVIGADGRILLRHAGPVLPADLDDRLRPALAAGWSP